MRRLLVLCSLFLLLPTSVKADDVPRPYLSEIAWSGSSSSIADEWIEVCGAPGTDLSGWTIAGAASGGGALMLPSGAALPGRGAYLIANDGQDDPKSTLDAAPDLVTTAVALANGDLFLELRDVGGAVVDLAGASGTAPFAGTSGDGHASMLRVLPLIDGGLAVAWTTAATSSGFDVGATDLGTPGSCPVLEAPVSPAAPVDEVATSTEPLPAGTTLPDSASSSEATAVLAAASDDATNAATGTPSVATPGLIRISELYPWPKAGEEEWVELVNLSDAAAALDGWSIEDAKPTATALTGTVGPWGRALIAHPKGQLNNDGDLVVLKDPSGRVVEGVAFGSAASPLYPNAGKLRQGEAIMRQDGQANFVVTTQPTPGAENVLVERPVAHASGSSGSAATTSPAPVPAPLPEDPSVAVISFPGSAPTTSRPSAPPTVSQAAAPASAAVKTVSVSAKPPKTTKSPYKGSMYEAVVAAPPGVYGKARLYVMIDGALKELRFSKMPTVSLAAGQRITFIAQEKDEDGKGYLSSNPKSLQLSDGDAPDAEEITSWPEESGLYAFEAEVAGVTKDTLTVRLGDEEGDLLAPRAAIGSLRDGDVVRFEGMVATDDRPTGVLASVDALKLVKAYVAPTPAAVKRPMKMPWPAVVALTALVVAAGLFLHLRRARLERLALLAPVDENAKT